MRSTAALLWDIWHRKRQSLWAIAGLTAAVRLFGESPGRPSALNEMLGMLSFVLLFGVFDYTEVGDSGGVGRFPQRLFVLPVSSLRLVAVPVVSGIVSVTLLYVLWMDLLSRGGTASPLFVAVLFGALMVCYQAVLWTLARLGPLRLVVLGAIGLALFVIGMLPSSQSAVALRESSPWRSETVLGALVAGAAVSVFLYTWQHVARLRSGGGRERHRLESLVGRLADALPRRGRGFASAMAAHFWYEWRCSGMQLPALVSGVLVIAIAPFSWLVRHDPADTLRLLLGTLATPIILAIPVGMVFSKPALWSDDLSVPAFVAVRPLSADELVATKVNVAAMSVAISWLVVLAFLGVWWSLWANPAAVSAVSGVSLRSALFVLAGIFLTWRFMIASLWSGLSGSRALFMASVVPVALAGIAWLVFDTSGLIDWMLEDPARLAPVVWIAAIVVALKYALAAYSWRRISARHVRRYLFVWLAETTCFVMLAVQLRGRLQSVSILLALMAVPLGRLGLAPSFLARNRHRP